MSEFLHTTFGKFELRVRKGYYYIEEGFWASVEDNKVKVGITDYFQRTLGDAAFVQFEREGSTIEKGKQIGMLETAKAAIDVISPVSGVIEKVNGLLDERPELVNQDPYEEGWFAILTPTNIEADLKTLINDDEYFKVMLKKLETDHIAPGV